MKIEYNFYKGKEVMRKAFESGKNYEQIVDKPFHESSAVGFAVKKKYCGIGAERVAYYMQEINKNNDLIGPEMIAKSSIYQDDDELEFHM